MIVKKAEYVKEYKIKLLFSDDVSKIVDFKPFIKSTRKIIAPLLDRDYFKRFYVDEITICWPNGLDFAPDLLYKIGVDVPVKTKQMVSFAKIKGQPAYAFAKKRSKKDKN